MTTHGRDVSDWDSGVVFGNYDFVISKASESTNFASRGRKAREAATRAAGKVFSQYHFAQPGNGAAQADWFLAVGGMPQKGDMSGWLDYEVDGLGIGFVNAFSNRYKARTGYWPGVYVDLSRYQGELQSGRGWRRPGQRLWIARYGASGPGVSCDIWQYQGGPDLDIAYTPLSQMVIGGSSHTVSEDASMGATTLADGTPLFALVGTNGRLYMTSDPTKGYTVVGVETYLPGVDVTNRSGNDAWFALRAKDKSIRLVNVPDVHAPTVGVNEQNLSGTGDGGPAIVVLNNGLQLIVKGTDPAHKVYVNTYVTGGKWTGWVPTKGQAG